MAESPENEDIEVELFNDHQPGEEFRCSKCIQINRRKGLITCSKCNNIYHRSCEGISAAAAEQIKNYICKTCRKGAPPNNSQSNLDNQTEPNFDILHHLKLCKLNISMLGNIPRGARITAAEALNDLINEVIQSNSSISWAKLLCFAYYGLQKPKKEKATSNSQSLVTKIKNQISVFINSSFPPTEFPFPLRTRKSKPKPKEEILKNRVNAKFAENDIRGAIRELSSEDTLAPDNPETLSKLKERHPEAPNGISMPLAPENDEAHIPTNSDSVKAAILSFPAGSAGGPDGLKPGHLKHLIGASEVGNRLLETLTKFVNFVLRETIPEDIQPIFFGANLSAL